jgi:hypothetical protein
VWDWRGTKDLTHKVGDERVSTWEKASGPAPFGPTAWLQLVELTSSVDQLRQLWTEARDHDALTEDFRAASRKRAELLAAGDK